MKYGGYVLKKNVYMFFILGSGNSSDAYPAAVQAELYRARDIENYDTAALRCWTQGGVEILCARCATSGRDGVLYFAVIRQLPR